MLNHLGQVVTWKLTTDLTFSHVKDTLTNLKGRLERQGKNLMEFYIDNCCSWRRKLQEVFGSGLKVKLDIFHAVKRVSDKIPKKHSLRVPCIEDLRTVFRDPTDKGPTRKKATPEPG